MTTLVLNIVGREGSWSRETRLSSLQSRLGRDTTPSFHRHTEPIRSMFSIVGDSTRHNSPHFGVGDRDNDARSRGQSLAIHRHHLLLVESKCPQTEFHETLCHS